MQETKETGVWLQGWEDPLEKEMELTPVFMPEKFHGQRGLVGYSPRGPAELDRIEVT